MTTGKISKEVVSERASFIREMLKNTRELPLRDPGEFLEDKRNVASAESYLRRALEALLDLGRHILAKGFGHPVTEYKEIPKGLLDKRVIGKNEASLMTKMAGYRNRMVHFYHEITPEELHEICRDHLYEVELMLEKVIEWMKNNRGKIDEEV